MPEVTPSSFLKSAIKAVPAVKYALGIGGIVAVIAIIKTFRVSTLEAILGAVVMLVLMVVLVVVSKFAAQSTGTFRPFIIVFAWFCLVLVMLTAFFLFSSAFFGWPRDLRGAIQSTQAQPQELPNSKIQRPVPETNTTGPALQLPTLTLVNCQPLGAQDSVSVNATHKDGPTISSFTTDGKAQTVPFLRHPERIYVEPPGISISASDLPMELTLGNCGDKVCKVTIKEFTDNGVVVDTSSAFVLTEKRETCGVQIKMTMLEAGELAPPKQGKQVKKSQSASPTQRSGQSSIQTGPINTGPCSNVQVGGQGNQAATNCVTTRSLTQEEKTQFVEGLRRGHPGIVTVWAVESGQSLGTEIYDALKAAGWQMQESEVQMMLLTKPMHEDIDVFVHGNPGDTGPVSTSDPPTVTLMHSLAALKRFKSGGMGHSESVAQGIVKVVVGPPVPN